MKVQVEAQNTGAWARHVDLPAPVGASTSLCKAFIRSCIFPDQLEQIPRAAYMLANHACASCAGPEKIARWILPPAYKTAAIVQSPGNKGKFRFDGNIGYIGSVACCIMLRTCVHNFSWCSSSLNFKSV